MTDVYPDFERREITLRGRTKTVFIKGQGRAVIVMHEMPGMHPGVAEFSRRVVDAGFRVYMPNLFGTPGRALSPAYSLETLSRACVASEFTMFASNKNSPVTEWLRDLAALAHQECGGPGVGAVGMCFTGGYALAMMLDDRMIAPVLSQPSIPVAFTAAQKRDLGIDDATLARVKERAHQGACVMGLRFTGDRLVPDERFARLREELGDKFIAVEIDSRPGNAHNIGRFAHSVLAAHYDHTPGHPTRDALDKVLAFYLEKLGT
jgi:dienelactone hydrolase